MLQLRPPKTTPRVRPSISTSALALALPAILAANTPALAHGTERAMVMLLPTGYYKLGAALAVAASFLVLLALPDRLFQRMAQARLRLFAMPARTAAITSATSTTGAAGTTSTLAFLLLAALVAAGRWGTADPLENPLPLFVWVFWWVMLATVQAVTGNLWRHLNPWSGPLAILRRLTGFNIGRTPLLPMREAIGQAPALILFFGFAWFELVSLAPEDPPGLAMVVAVYWVLTLGAMIVFGEDTWSLRGEPFSIYFRMIGMLSPFCRETASPRPATRAAHRQTLVVTWPGQACLDRPPPPLGAALMILLSLGTAAFDGFSETFTWLGAIGVNPLDFPGRSGVTGANTIGLIIAPLLLGGLYTASVFAGAWLAGERSVTTIIRLARHLVYSVLPIAVAFHAAHYLTLMLVNGQYLMAVLSDPFGLGWNLFGTAHWHVTTSFLTNLDGAKKVWIAQTAIIVTGHCLGILLAHMIALRHFGTGRRAARSQIFLALAMVFYTVFGLWLLSTPSAG